MIRPVGLSRRRRGAVVALVAICLVALLGVVVLVLEAGRLQDMKRQAQKTADAAALAGAVDLFINYNQNQGLDLTGTAALSAQTEATNNGFQNGANNNVVTVTVPGQTPLQSDAAIVDDQGKLKRGYMEVTIVAPQPQFFSTIWGVQNLSVKARAVARGKFTAADPGILLLEPSAAHALDDTGNGNIVVTGGGSVIINSNNSMAATLTGNGSVQSKQANVTGQNPGYTTSGGGQFLGLNGMPQNPNTNVPPTPDPFANLPVPPQPGVSPDASTARNYSGGADLTLRPGDYPNGIKATGSGNIILQPGIYYLDGGSLAITGQGGISVAQPGSPGYTASPDTGSGVLIYNASTKNSDTVQLAGGGSMSLQPPTIGPYTGITIFQNRSSPAPVQITGNGSANILGAVYAAGAQLQVTGNGGLNALGQPQDIIGNQYVVNSLKVTGNGGFQVFYNGGNQANVRMIGLVE
jgi:hypothetical protein